MINDGNGRKREKVGIMRTLVKANDKRSPLSIVEIMQFMSHNGLHLYKKRGHAMLSMF